MPFVRFARDKRGYEYIYLVHESSRGNKPSRPTVLYWYRTPPGVKVGRPPFDEEVRQRLEAQNPDLKFDWRAITSAQPPPPDVEHWRERRRAEKAAKLARLQDEQADGEEPLQGETGSLEPEPSSADEGQLEASAGLEVGPQAPGAAAAVPTRRKRRRSGRRRRPDGARIEARAAANEPNEPPIEKPSEPTQEPPEGTNDS